MLRSDLRVLTVRHTRLTIERNTMAAVPPLAGEPLAVGSKAELDHPALPSVTAVLAEDETGLPVQPLTFRRLSVGVLVTVLAEDGGEHDSRSLVVRALHGEHS